MVIGKDYIHIYFNKMGSHTMCILPFYVKGDDGHPSAGARAGQTRPRPRGLSLLLTLAFAVGHVRGCQGLALTARLLGASVCSCVGWISGGTAASGVH